MKKFLGFEVLTTRRAVIKNITKKVFSVIIFHLKFFLKRRTKKKYILPNKKTLLYFNNLKYIKLVNYFKNAICISSRIKKDNHLNNNFIFLDNGILPKSNADFYIFDNKTIRFLYTNQFFPNFMAFPLLRFEVIFRLWRPFLRKQLAFNSITNISGKFFIILQKTDIQEDRLKTRKYIPYPFEREEFLLFMKEMKYNYVVLRWFDDIRNYKGLDEDIDILMDDDDVTRFSNEFSEAIGIYPIDLYSISGLEGSNYQGLPYYPHPFSKQILENKILYQDKFYIPNPEYHLLSFIYHILFHKASTSGLKMNDINSINNNFIPEHDYENVLQNLFCKYNIAFRKDITLENLYEFLKLKNIKPTYDLITKLSDTKGKDIWYDKLINTEQIYLSQQYPMIEGLTIFILRYEAFFLLDELIKLLDFHGFDVIKKGEIRDTILATHNMRGGNWGKGPFKKSGGIPFYYIIAYDAFGSKPKDDLLKKYPRLSNRKVLILKENFREYCIDKDGEYFNGLHSSDNFFESIQYLENLLFTKEEIIHIIDKCKSIEITYNSQHEVICNLSRASRRAKVELIKYGNGKAIKKTFKNNKLQYLNREVNFLKRFSNNKYIPQLFEVGINYCIIEYFDNPIYLEEISIINYFFIIQIYDFLKLMYDNSFTLLDFNPSNVLIVNNCVKVIDFEFAQIYKKKPEKMLYMYELSNIPKDFDGDIPFGHEFSSLNNAYALYWQSKLGMSLKSFISNNNLLKLFCFIINKINLISYLHDLVKKFRIIWKQTLLS
jgi:predicted Ser/Thr protein kinase